jgi:16S rRNA processing protein RimM
MSADERVVLEVGQIMKAHGLKGQVSVALLTDRIERVAPGMVLETDRGPLHVTASLAHQNRFLVNFAEIPDRVSAERWRGVMLRAEAIDDDDVIWIHDLFGATVETTDGVLRGVVVSVEDNPASDILVLDTGDLVPLTFVVSVKANERIVVDVPEGLFE